ncbi:GNAT family N-acetyltransferase [Cupriavidus sp. TMH.W2]|uniref:GNAT family N-acetyltransferase n=1 Tax=Cupriavidus sp. TMH.W2 TaxID=3434465 RepID=UPI003D789418
MATHAHLRSASQADLPQIAVLLEQCRLTREGITKIVDSFHVAHCDGRIIGCAAAERHGESIVIRSVAVEPACRDRGVATRLVDALLMRARGTEVRHAVLLSASAPAYFARWGFSLIPADKAPSDARASSEFQDAAQTSALCMHCELR